MKGISPLIASILLIAFTVAVAGVVSLWLTSFSRTTTITVQQQAEIELICSYGGISLSNLNFCDPYLTGNMENTGTINLGNISLQIVYPMSASRIDLCLSDNTVTNCTTSNLTMLPREMFSFNVSISSGFNKVRLMSNCSAVYDDVSSGEITSSC
jgi:flagellin-like protein